MTFEKALEAMRHGKRVYRKAWTNGIAVALDSKNKIRYWIKDDDNHYGGEYIFNSIENFADDWEIYEEPQEEENELSSSVKLLSDFAKSLQFDLGNTAMRTINSYQISDIVSALKTVLDYAKSTIKPAYIKNQEDKEPEMTAEKASKILDLILDYINVGEFEYITRCSFIEIVESIRMAIKALENQNQPKPEKKSKCGLNCQIQPAKWFSDEKLAFDNFAAGLKCGLNIAKDSQKENIDNA